MHEYRTKLEGNCLTDQIRVLVLLGNDESAINDLLKEQAEAIGDPSARDLNLARLDGRQATLEDLATAAGAIPFLAQRRLVILLDPLARLENRDAQNRFQKLMENLPSTTIVVLVIDDHQEFKNGQMRWQKLNEVHWLRKWAAGTKQASVRIVECLLPPVREMPRWILKEAQTMGGTFSPAASEALAAHVDNDTLLARQEIGKILLYTGQRTVEAVDIELLTPAHGQVSVFEMVDALVAGRSQRAIQLLHRLLETGDPVIIFSMVVRQFRLLIQAREAFDEGCRPDQIGTRIGIPNYTAKHLVPQVHFFTLPQLEGIYRRLLEIDEAVKSSQVTVDTALDLLITDLARQ
jgi:DNA polymerase III subunit delta